MPSRFPVTLTIRELVRLMTGGTQPGKNPKYAQIMAETVRQAQAGQLELVSRCISGGFAYSRVNRETAIAWMRAQEITVPPELR